MEQNKYLHFINQFWDKVTQHNPTDYDRIIGLPFPYVSPNSDKYTDLYYWDSYFHILGLLASGRVELAKNIVDNFIYLIERFGLIPNANCFFFLSRSQPPFLSSMILEVYEKIQDRAWLKKAFEAVKSEYEEVWTGTSWKNRRNVFKNLSRYYDINDIHFMAELESGWDLTSRFLGRCMDILPIDLNTLLYKYETDFAAMVKILELDEKEVKKWENLATVRKNTINELMWDDKNGIFRDYDYVSELKTEIFSLAAYFPLYFKLASQEQAEALVKNISRFECEGGLVTTDHETKMTRDAYAGASHIQQWDYPNGWAPLHLIVIQGLMNYGFYEDAKRLAKKWLHTCEVNFDRDGFFMEKYNVVEPLQPAKGHYGVQEGFGWTNAVYVVLHQLLHSS